MAGGEHTPLAFSKLQGAVGVDDNGKFNYHLSQVLGTFVEKVEEGYRLKPAGISVFQSVKSGAYAGNVVVDPTKKESRVPRATARRASGTRTGGCSRAVSTATT